MMVTVRKKPIVVKAFKEGTEAPLWFTRALHNGESYYNDTSGKLTICTPEGHMEISKGDWVIQGVNGEIYPCKPDIFEKTYEILEVEDE